MHSWPEEERDEIDLYGVHIRRLWRENALATVKENYLLTWDMKMQLDGVTDGRPRDKVYIFANEDRTFLVLRPRFGHDGKETPNDYVLEDGVDVYRLITDYASRPRLWTEEVRHGASGPVPDDLEGIESSSSFTASSTGSELGNLFSDVEDDY